MTGAREIVDLVRKGNDNSESVTFQSFTVETDIQVETINYLSHHNCIKDFYDEACLGKTISFSLDWEELLPFGVYRTKDEFVRLNQGRSRGNFYIDEEQIFDSSKSLFLDLYILILKLRENLKAIANHCFEESGSEYIIVSSNQQSVVVDLFYAIGNFHEKDIPLINDFVMTLSEYNEKQKLYISELVDFFCKSELSNLASLLDNFRYVSERCAGSYEFYLSGFSFNNMKLEIDSKALEYTNKLQGVINESQTKLIAIPAAFVFAATSLNFNGNIIFLDIENIAVVLGTIIFAIFIQLFLSNQLSSLEFIKDSITDYKKFCGADKIAYINDKFKTVDKVRRQQKNKIVTAICLLWTTPVLLVILLTIKQLFEI